MKNILALAIVLPFIFSCNKTEEVNQQNQTEIQENIPNSENKTNSESITNHIIIKSNDDMTFDKTSFTVKVGEEITLLLFNNGSSSKEAMGHNVVILNEGTDISSFAFAASSEKENDYIPNEMKASIIAHTKLLGGKENDQIKFKFDKVGEYDFICSFPGHTATMNGKIKVIN